MKRIFFAVLVIAAFNPDISPAAKRQRIEQEACDVVDVASDVENDCSNDMAIARALGSEELDHDGGQRAKRRKKQPKTKQLQPKSKRNSSTKSSSAHSEGLMGLRAEIERVRADTLRLAQPRLVALQKERWEKYQAKKEAQEATEKGRTALAYTASFAGSFFSAISSGFGLFSRGPVVGGPFVGLVNNGNLCYQNAVMQAVHKCVPLRDALQANFEAQSAAGIIMPGYIQEFFATQSALSGAVVPYDPVAFCTGVQAGIIDAAGRGMFPIGEQKDASEFIQIFWDRLQRAAVVPLVTAVDDGFHGVASQDQLVCAVCGAERFAAQECSTTLSLAIPAGDAAFSLNDLIAHHCAEAVLAGDNAVECDGACAARTTHRKAARFVINPAQQFMMVQVKRFEYLMTGQRVKRSNPITMPADGVVVINDSAGVAHRFKVVSVVVHAGTANGGHYWAVTPHTVCDDERVIPDGGATMRQLLTTGLQGQYGTGYFYFLERV